jgi:hypothetical protein
VLAGTYTFTATVPVTLDGVRIYGSRGAILETSSSMGPLFDVAGDGFALDGLTLLEDPGTSGGLVRIEGDEPSITGCTFELPSSTEGGDWAVELDGSESPVDGALVQGNVFRFGFEAVGRGGLQAKECRSLRIHGNSFTRSYEGSPADYHGALDLQECSWTTLGANTFSGLKNTDVPAVSFANDASPSRTAIRGNYFEVVLGRSLLHLEGPGSWALTSNAFGRVTGVDGAVFLTGAAGAVVAGNQFHNQGASEEGQTCSSLQDVDRAVQADNAADVIVSDNTFLMCKSVQIGTDGAAGATAMANRFIAIPGLAYAICAAIDFDASGHTVAIGNVSQVNFGAVLTSSGADFAAENHDL